MLIDRLLYLKKVKVNPKDLLKHKVFSRFPLEKPFSLIFLKYAR